LPALDESDFFGKDTLDFVGEYLVLFNKVISLDLSPEFSFPIVVLQVNQCNQIPQDFQVFQVRNAFFQWLVISSFQFEQVFEFGILLGLLFKGLKLNIVFIDLVINFHDFLGAHVVIVSVWQVGFEFVFEVLDFVSECVEFLLYFDCFVTNDVDDIFLDFIYFLLCLVEAAFGGFDGLERFFFALFGNLNAMLLQLRDHVSHSFDDA
jgi:hypothetical protein